MAIYKTPGVYIEEISTLPASVAAVETAIPAFVGYTAEAEKDGVNVTGKAIRISSLLEYREIFGGPNNEGIDVVLNDTVNSANEVTNRSVVVTIPSVSKFKLYYQLQMFFNNGGGDCYILSVGDYSTGVSQSELTDGVKLLETVDEPTLLLFPDAVSLDTVGEYGQVIQASLDHCNKLQDRFTIADMYGSDATVFRGQLGTDYLKYGAAYYPFLETTLNYGFDESVVDITAHNQSGGGAVTSLAGTTLATLASTEPSLYRTILAEIAKKRVVLSPCGSVAGIYARVDRDRGVWKAPANVGVRSVVGPVTKITHEQQESLNVDASTGKSINAIRVFTGKGTLVWGARTLAGNDNEWRYVPVRRLYIFIEESVKKATEFVVFEPNDANTWLRTKTMIENFLTTLWRVGALAGAKTNEAFFVKVGLGETMTAQDILEGRMIIEIGMAAVRPAEFIILKFSHKMQES
ncbi:phage tail sheath family protein [Mangrovibacterium sp.]|uniref:phage tail sheath family protein n=1 Tax=Mangrovibacterium sp. TaxID=1961364 RepID=UPI0035660DCE